MSKPRNINSLISWCQTALLLASGCTAQFSHYETVAKEHLIVRLYHVTTRSCLATVQEDHNRYCHATLTSYRDTPESSLLDNSMFLL